MGKLFSTQLARNCEMGKLFPHTSRSSKGGHFVEEYTNTIPTN